jgi:hypothetical protein
MAIMVVSFTIVLNIPEVTVFISGKNVADIRMVTMPHIFKSVLIQDISLPGSLVRLCAPSILRTARTLCTNVIPFDVDKVRLGGGTFGMTGGD